VLPDASFCTIGDDGVFFDRIPGLPAENVTCLGGGGGGGWLALDCTDSVHRRTSLLEKILTNTLLPTRCDVKHRHTYLLHNPFTNATVPLPELDSAFGHVTDEFEIRKVLMMMRSGDGDDGDGDVVVAVTTNSYKYSVVVCRPGKGMCVVPNLHILDVAFLADTLYAVTVDEDVIAFDLTEDGNGRPTVAQYKRVIRRPLADGEEDLGSWMDDDDDDEGEDELSSNSMEEEEDESNVDELSSNGEEEEEDEDQESDDEAAPHDTTEEEEDAFNSYGKVARTVEYADENKKVAAAADDDNEHKDYTTTARYLVASSDGKELLMVRHHQQTPPSSGAYTLKVEVFRADLSLREWVPIVAGDGGGGGLAGEALFLSRSFGKSTPAYGGGVEEGLVYVAAPVDDVFDTRCWVPRTFTMPWQRKLAAAQLLTWLFPPELVV